MNTLLNLTRDITSEKAYFLGAILTANESYIQDNKKIWLAPVRHNPGQATAHDIKQHYNFLKIMSDNVSGDIISAEALGSNMGFSAGKKGFATLFESNTSINLSYIIENIRTFDDADISIKRALLIGAFDGRSSFDRNKQTGDIRNIAVDCEDRMVHAFISRILSNFNINPLTQNESRERLTGGRPRKNQLRIPKSNLSNFATSIGFISPFRFKIFRQCFASDLPFTKNEDYVLPGLKSLSDIQFDIIEEENRLDESVIETTNNENIIPTIHQYSGTPKTKTAPSFIKGRKIYSRNPQTAINALALANYKCEIDEIHPTFIRRKNGKPYTEPHHLIPMAFSDRFNVSLDVEENIVSLCSHCHNLLHYGKDAKELLDLLFDKRKNMLENVGISIDLEDLYEMYRID